MESTGKCQAFVTRPPERPRVPDIQSRPYLPAMLGFLHQAQADGELVLEQNDGTRRLYLQGGELRYLRSDAVGEQFGNYLIRLGVLDYNALKDLLKEEGARVGEKVVQWGLMTAEERDARLGELFGNILLHAVEHPVLSMAWNPGGLEGSPAAGLSFRFDHRRVIWDVYRKMQTFDALLETFDRETAWAWSAKESLLETMADLTLTPQLAFAISQLGREPMTFPTVLSVTGLEEHDAARLVATLWALGGLELAGGTMESFIRAEEAAEPEPEFIDAAESPADAFAAPPLPPTAAPEPPPLAPEVPIPLLLDRPDAPGAPARPKEPKEESSDPTPQMKARGLFLQAESLQMQARTSEAIRALEQAIKLDPDSPRSYDAWMMLGDLRQGNPAWSTRAVEAYQAAANAQPKKGEPWLRMGELYHRKGFGTNATGCFRKALEIDPSLEVPDDKIGNTVLEGGKEGLLGRLKGFLGGDKKGS